MRETTRDPGSLQESAEGELPGAELVATGPSETELVTVALLMRLYDVGMAILSHLDKPTADQIFDAHENGGTFNPPIFIPDANQE